MKVRESAYYGRTTCTLAASSSPLASAFAVEEGPLAADRTKYCTLLLTATNFTEEAVEVNLLLLVDPASTQTSCDNVVADRARIEVTFRAGPAWEMVDNTVTFLRPRGEKSDKQLSRPNTRWQSGRQVEGGGQAGGQGGQADQVGIGKQPEDDRWVTGDTPHPPSSLTLLTQ